MILNPKNKQHYLCGVHFHSGYWVNAYFKVSLILVIFLMMTACEEREWDNPHDTKSDKSSWTPSNIQLEPLSDREIRLTWQDNAESEDGFKIDRKTGIDDWIIGYGQVGENIEKWTDTLIVSKSMNRYRLYAFAGSNISDIVEAQITSTFPAPSNLNTVQLSPTEVELTWQDNSNGEHGFLIDRKVGSGEWEIVYGVVSSNINRWIDDDITPLKYYYYRIYAYIGAGESSAVEDSLFTISYRTTLLVPSEYTTVQAAIDYASAGDTVLVDPGTYFENINFLGKNIVVGSLFLTTGDTGYVSQTVIDGGDAGCVVTFWNGEDSTAVLSGLTVTNGNGESGGGISCKNSDPSLLNLAITGNSLPSYGRGGGLYCSSSNPNLKNVTISKNYATYGGGIHCILSSPSLESVTILGNRAIYGGGIYCEGNSNINLKNVTIIGNITTWSGGGIYCSNSSPSLDNVIVSGNVAGAGDGGGIKCLNSKASLVNVIVSGNTARNEGGGLYFDYNSNSSLVNVTVSENTAGTYGGGIYCSNSKPSLMNTILWNNSPQEIYMFDMWQGNTIPSGITITYSNVEGGSSEIIITGNQTIDWNTGNMNVDPLFVDPANSDFHLKPGSPCIDAGNPELQYNGPDGSRNDMGAYGGPSEDW